jgi:hypothetical protein
LKFPSGTSFENIDEMIEAILDHNAPECCRLCSPH